MKVLVAFATLLAVAFAKPSGYTLPLAYSGYPFAYSGLPLDYSGRIIAAPARLSSQFHSQDTLGQYSYGYNDGLSSKKEIKSIDGVTRGSYSYVDAEGKLQTVDYTADAINGFRVAGTNLPKPIKGAELSLPTPIREDPAVVTEREIHLAAVEEAKIRNRTPVKPIDLSTELPKPVTETPEVAKAKVEHLAAVKDAEIRDTLIKDIPVIRAPVSFSTLPLAHAYSTIPAVAPWSTTLAPWEGRPIIRADIPRPFVYSVDSLRPELFQLRDGLKFDRRDIVLKGW